MQQVFTPEEVASTLRIKRRMVVSGPLRHALPWVRVGRFLRLPAEALDEYLASGGTHTTARRGEDAEA